MQEQIEEKTVALMASGAKMTGRELAKAMRAFLRRSHGAPGQQSRPAVPDKHGRQSVRSLTRQGASLANIEITGDNIGSFKKTARKYNVDFALKRDSTSTMPRWLVFFKAKDADALTAAFKEYSKAVLKVKAHKPSMLAKLNKYKALAKTAATPVKNRNKGDREI